MVIGISFGQIHDSVNLRNHCSDDLDDLRHKTTASKMQTRCFDVGACRRLLSLSIRLPVPDRHFGCWIRMHSRVSNEFTCRLPFLVSAGYTSYSLQCGIQTPNALNANCRGRWWAKDTWWWIWLHFHQYYENQVRRRAHQIERLFQTTPQTTARSRAGRRRRLSIIYLYLSDNFHALKSSMVRPFLPAGGQSLVPDSMDSEGWVIEAAISGIWRRYCGGGARHQQVAGGFVLCWHCFLGLGYFILYRF
jgi:hypothetical protein